MAALPSPATKRSCSRISLSNGRSDAAGLAKKSSTADDQTRISIVGRAISKGQLLTATMSINHQSKGQLIRLHPSIIFIYSDTLTDDETNIWP